MIWLLWLMVLQVDHIYFYIRICVASLFLSVHFFLISNSLLSLCMLLFRFFYHILFCSFHSIVSSWNFHSSLCSNIGVLVHLLDNLLKFYTLFIFVNNYCCLCISIVGVHVLCVHCFGWLLDTRNIVIIIIIIRGKLKITSFVLTTNGRPGWQLNLTMHTTILDSSAKLFYLFKYTHTQVSRALIS